MAKNRKKQAAEIRFGPVLKVVLLCSLICGSAVGYVWQKSQIYQLGKQIHEKESRLTQLAHDNGKLDRQLSDLRSVVMLDARAHNLGLAPAQPGQVVRLPEMPLALPGNQITFHQLAARPADVMPQ